MFVTIYCDTTGLFSENEINGLLDGRPATGNVYYGNICDMDFDEVIVRMWFEERIKAYKPTMTFERWYNDEYTAEDTDGLYNFAIERGDSPTFGVNGKFRVFYGDSYLFMADYDECRRFCKENNWLYMGEKLEVLK